MTHHRAALLLAAALTLSLSACSREATVPDDATDTPVADTGEQEESKAITDAPFVDGQLIVRFQDGLGRDQMVGIVTQRGDAVLRYSIGSSGSLLIEINSGREVLEAVRLYTSLPEVEYAEPNYVRDRREEDPNP